MSSNATEELQSSGDDDGDRRTQETENTCKKGETGESPGVFQMIMGIDEAADPTLEVEEGKRQQKFFEDSTSDRKKS